MALFLQSTKMRQLLCGYWLLVPLLFGAYLFTLATVKNVPVGMIFTSIPSLTLASIVVLLMIFQLYGLYIIGHSSESRHSLLGSYLIVNTIQQLLSFNIPGFVICLLFYRSLHNEKERSRVPKQIKWIIYGLMSFISFMTMIILWLQLSL